MLPFYFLKTLERRPGLIRGRQNCLVGEYDLMIPELPQNAVKFIFRQPSEDHHGCGKRGSRVGSCGAICLKAGQSRQGAQRIVLFGRFHLFQTHMEREKSLSDCCFHRTVLQLEDQDDFFHESILSAVISGG